MRQTLDAVFDIKKTKKEEAKIKRKSCFIFFSHSFSLSFIVIDIRSIRNMYVVEHVGAHTLDTIKTINKPLFA